MTRHARFEDAFWETDFVSTHGFDVLSKHMKDGRTTCKEVEEYFKQRARAEQQYSKSLLSLGRVHDGNDDSRTITAAWFELRNQTEKIAHIHEETANMFTRLVDEVSAFTVEQKQSTKQIEDRVRESQKNKRTNYNKTMDLQKTYSQKCRDKDQAAEVASQAGNSVTISPKELEKAKSKSEGANRAMEQADNSYKVSVDNLEKTRAQWESDMSESCEAFQKLDEERLNFFRDMLWKCSNVVSRACVEDDSCCETVRKLLEKCDVDDDILDFIKKNMTGNVRPVPVTYENYYEKQLRHNYVNTTPPKAKTARRPQQPLPGPPTIRGPPKVPILQNPSSEPSAVYSHPYSDVEDNSAFYAEPRDLEYTRYRVIQTYVPAPVLQGSSHLAIYSGQIVTLLNSSPGKPMVEVKIQTSGQTGLVPSSCLQEIL